MQGTLIPSLFVLNMIPRYDSATILSQQLLLSESELPDVINSIMAFYALFCALQLCSAVSIQMVDRVGPV